MIYLLLKRGNYTIKKLRKDDFEKFEEKLPMLLKSAVTFADESPQPGLEKKFMNMFSYNH